MRNVNEKIIKLLFIKNKRKEVKRIKKLTKK